MCKTGCDGIYPYIKQCGYGWRGYRGQPIVLVDLFGADRCMRFDRLVRILNRRSLGKRGDNIRLHLLLESAERLVFATANNECVDATSHPRDAVHMSVHNRSPPQK